MSSKSGDGVATNRMCGHAYGFPFDHRASRFEEAFTIIRTLLADGYIDFSGTYYTLRDCELAPRARPDIPLMVGSEGPRVLSATLPHVDSWNGWHAWYENTPEGASKLLSKVDAAAVAVGRDPAEIEKTVTVLVEIPGGSGRAAGSSSHGSSVPIVGDPIDIAQRLAAFADVGIDHVQLVVDPITVASIEWLGGALASLDGP